MQPVIVMHSKELAEKYKGNPLAAEFELLNKVLKENNARLVIGSRAAAFNLVARNNKPLDEEKTVERLRMADLNDIVFSAYIPTPPQHM